MLIFQPFHKSHWMHDRKTFWLSQNATLLDNASLFPCYLRLRFTPSCLMAPTTEISVIDWLIDWLHGINGHIHEESVCCNIKNDSCDLITCRGHDRGALPCFRFSTVGMQPLHTLRLPILYKSSRSKTLLNLFFYREAQTSLLSSILLTIAACLRIDPPHALCVRDEFALTTFIALIQRVIGLARNATVAFKINGQGQMLPKSKHFYGSPRWVSK